jgi:long-chain fatty acid transport protein
MKQMGIIFLAALLVMGLAGTAFATNGYQLMGVGQIQRSMGGAVTAAPVDSMTAITNPAGMARIGKRADFSMEAFMPTRSVDFSEWGGDREEGGSELYGIPSVGWTAPAFGRDDVYFGGGMFATSGMGVDYGESVFVPGATLDAMGEQMFGLPAGSLSGTFENVTFDGYSLIQFWKMAPTVAWNVNDKLSVGAALNIDYQSITINEVIRNVPFWNDPMAASTGDFSAGITQRTVSLDLGRPTSQMGFGAGFGVLYDVNDWLTLGASYDSQQMFSEAEFRVGTGDISTYGGAMGVAGTYKMDLEFPQQLAVGAAIKPVEKLTVSMDVKWLDWASTHDSITLTGPKDSFDTDGDGVGDTSSTELAFGWDSQWIYALGLQYAATDALTLRMGYNFAESPIDEADVFNNLVFPAIVEQHLAFGFDYMLGEHWGIGMTYMKVFENTLVGSGDVPEDFQYLTPFEEDSGSEISLEEDEIGMQLTYRF